MYQLKGILSIISSLQTFKIYRVGKVQSFPPIPNCKVNSDKNINRK